MGPFLVWLGVLSAFTFLGLCLFIYCLIEIKAMQRSTHQVSFVNGPKPNQPFEEFTDELKEKLTDTGFDNIE